MRQKTIISKGFESPDVEVIILDKTGNYSRELAQVIRKQLSKAAKEKGHKVSFKIVLTEE